jgi:hypothetical protein
VFRKTRNWLTVGRPPAATGGHRCYQVTRAVVPSIWSSLRRATHFSIAIVALLPLPLLLPSSISIVLLHILFFPDLAAQANQTSLHLPGMVHHGVCCSISSLFLVTLDVENTGCRSLFLGFGALLAFRLDLEVLRPHCRFDGLWWLGCGHFCLRMAV